MSDAKEEVKKVSAEIWEATTRKSIWEMGTGHWGGDTAYIQTWKGTTIATSKREAAEILTKKYFSDTQQGDEKPSKEQIAKTEQDILASIRPRGQCYSTCETVID